MNTTGFPSPAQGYEEETFDFNAILVKHPASVFPMRYKGHSLADEGIFMNDILIIDSALAPAAGKLAVINTLLGEFRCVRLEQPLSNGDSFCYSDEYGTVQTVKELFGIVSAVVRCL